MGWNFCSARNSSLCPLLQASSVSFGTSAQLTLASMEVCVWPHTPRSSAAAHLALRVMPANMMSMSASRTLDSAPKAPPAIIPWAPTNVSALQGGRVYTVSSEQDPAPWQAVQMGAPASWCQGETPPFTNASAPQVCPHRGFSVAPSPFWEGKVASLGFPPLADPMTLSGFTGLDCEVNPDDCVEHHCQNGGTCQDGLGTYTCLCPETWTGELFKPS